MTNKHQQQKNRPRDKSRQESSSPIDEHTLNANKLYEEVKRLINSAGTPNAERARLIIELADDAIEEFGATNQDRKVELRKIKTQFEELLPPTTIDELRKRAEGKLLVSTYPRNKILRNLVLVTFGLGSLLLSGILIAKQVKKSESPINVTVQNKQDDLAAKVTPEIKPPPATPETIPPKQSSPTVDGNKTQAASLVHQCQSLFDLADYQGALKACDEAISKDPENQKALDLKRKINKIVTTLNSP